MFRQGFIETFDVRILHVWPEIRQSGFREIFLSNRRGIDLSKTCVKEREMSSSHFFFFSPIAKDPHHCRVSSTSTILKWMRSLILIGFCVNVTPKSLFTNVDQRSRREKTHRDRMKNIEWLEIRSLRAECFVRRLLDEMLEMSSSTHRWS